jgi:hypothetical protein
MCMEHIGKNMYSSRWEYLIISINKTLHNNYYDGTFLVQVSEQILVTVKLGVFGGRIIL